MEQYWNVNKYKVLAPEAGGDLIIANVITSDIGPIYRYRVTNALVFITRDSPFSYQLNQIGQCKGILSQYAIICAYLQRAILKTSLFMIH